jgi:hypothetical protein
MQGVSPQKMNNEFENESPAQTFVNPALQQAAKTLCAVLNYKIHL